jgi:hypothetical protein
MQSAAVRQLVLMAVLQLRKWLTAPLQLTGQMMSYRPCTATAGILRLKSASPMANS